MGPLDTGLDFYRTVLDLRGYRQQLLSADIANAATPRFKAVDLDFRQALSETLSNSPSTAPASPNQNGLLRLVSESVPAVAMTGRGADVRNAVKYQIGAPVTLDGNSVDLDYEKRVAAENALDYQAVINFTSRTVNMLMTAIKGSAARGASSNGP